MTLDFRTMLYLQNVALKKFYNSRWFCRINSLFTIKTNYETIMKTLSGLILIYENKNKPNSCLNITKKTLRIFLFLINLFTDALIK